MDYSSWTFDNVKAEKASSMRRYNRLRTVAKLFRVAELFTTAVLLSWSFSRLPFVVRISFDYLRLLSSVVSTPPFVFLVCNLIIVSLFAKSRHIATLPPDDGNVNVEEARIYGGLAQKSDPTTGNDAVDAEEVVYEDKRIVSEVVNAEAEEEEEEEEEDPKLESDSGSGMGFPKAIRRTKSDKFERTVPESKKKKKLQRSETEDCRKMLKSGEQTVPVNCVDDEDLSNEEFQRAIEEFIEKQKRFRHQEESMAIVLQN